MIPDVAIRLEGVGKCYHLYDAPRDRLLQILRGYRHQYYREFWAVRGVSLDIRKGEVIGVIGRNGAGKSTLLQLICGTLHPTEGDISVNGRIAAILELGAGFNPEYTGRENIYLSAALMGLSHLDIDAKYADIVSFSGIGDFIEQPVKSYSSGMYVRLAFSVATSVDPEILIIDEALSVGDGEFSRKSFDRIMEMKERGVTILFCSHSLYHVEAFCDRVMWLDRGECARVGESQEIISLYQSSILESHAVVESSEHPDSVTTVSSEPPKESNPGYFTGITISMDGVTGTKLKGESRKSSLSVQLTFSLTPTFPDPVIGLNIDYESAFAAVSVVSSTDQITIRRGESGCGFAEIFLPELPLRKGHYFVSVYLACENAMHLYDQAERIASFEMIDPYPEPGLFSVPHQWRVSAADEKEWDDLIVTLPWGQRIETDSVDSLGLRHNRGQYETHETDLCRRLVKPGDRVLDVGANIGYFSLLLGALVCPDGCVVAIEPDPDNYYLLQRNIAMNDLSNTVLAHQLAFGSSSYKGQLFQAIAGNGQHRLFASVCCCDKMTEVDVVAGDTLGLAPLDFVKIDIEGYEPTALRGLAETIMVSPDLKILCEFSPLSIWESGASPVDFLEEMRSLNFQLVTFEAGGWKEIAFDVLFTELKKIPQPAVAELINSFPSGCSPQIVLEQVEEFLTKYDYQRPHLENILLVSSQCWPQVKIDLQQSLSALKTSAASGLEGTRGSQDPSPI